MSKYKKTPQNFESKNIKSSSDNNESKDTTLYKITKAVRLMSSNFSQKNCNLNRN
jgi:hypothetical protein